MHILVVQTAFLGDVILTTPFLKAIQNVFAGSHLHVVTTREGADALEGFPQVQCHIIDKRSKNFSLSTRAIFTSLSPYSFDYVFVVHRSLRSLWIGSRVSSKAKLSFFSMWAWLLGYQTVAYPEYNNDTHYAQKPLTLLKQLGFETRSSIKPILFTNDTDEVKMKNLLPEKYIVMSPFSNWGTKMWFSDRFSKVGAVLGKRFQLPVILIGNSHDMVIAGAMAESISAQEISVINLVGKTTIGELKVVLKHAKLLVSNDSAPVHIASSFDVPTVAIFGPTVKKWGFFPLSTKSKTVEKEVSCRPCSLHGPQKCPMKHFRCMDTIQVDDVVQAAEQVW